MSEKREKLPVYVTPRGTAKYTHLNKPQTEINGKPVKSTYSITLVMPEAEAAPVLALISAGMAASLEQAKAANPKKKVKSATLPYKAELDEEENQTGNLMIKFKAKASGERKDGTKWTFKPTLFDAKGKPLPSAVSVWGGSIVKVAYDIRPFYTDMVGAGVSLGLKSVQVIDLKTGSDKDAKSYGFGEEEGYEVPDEDTTAADNAGAGDGKAPASAEDF